MALGCSAKMLGGDVRFSNRPGEVKRFQLSTTTVSMSIAGSRFSSESALRPFHHGIRGWGGTIFRAALPHLSAGPKRTCELTSSIVPRGTSIHRLVELDSPSVVIWFYLALMPLRLPWSSGIRCHQPRCGA